MTWLRQRCSRETTTTPVAAESPFNRSAVETRACRVYERQRNRRISFSCKRKEIKRVGAGSTDPTPAFYYNSRLGCRCASGTPETGPGPAFLSSSDSLQLWFAACSESMAKRILRSARCGPLFWISQARRSTISNSSKPATFFGNRVPPLDKLPGHVLRDSAKDVRSFSKLFPARTCPVALLDVFRASASR